MLVILNIYGIPTQFSDGLYYSSQDMNYEYKLCQSGISVGI